MMVFSMLLRIIFFPAFLLYMQIWHTEPQSLERTVVSMGIFVIIIVNLATAEIKEEIREQNRKR